MTENMTEVIVILSSVTPIKLILQNIARNSDIIYRMNKGKKFKEIQDKKEFNELMYYCNLLSAKYLIETDGLEKTLESAKQIRKDRNMGKIKDEIMNGGKNHN